MEYGSEERVHDLEVQVHGLEERLRWALRAIEALALSAQRCNPDAWRINAFYAGLTAYSRAFGPNDPFIHGGKS